MNGFKRQFLIGFILTCSGAVHACFKGEDSGFVDRFCGAQVAISKDGSWEIHIDEEGGEFFTGYGFKDSNNKKFVKIDGFCQQGVVQILEYQMFIHTYCPYMKKSGLYNVLIEKDGRFKMIPVPDNDYSRKFPNREFKRQNLSK